MKGIRFGDKHSYDDWGLILSERPDISPPKAKTVYVDISGTDGKLDLTSSLTGDVKYQNRTFRASFSVIDARDRWSNIYSEIMNYLQGQNIKVVLDEDAEFCYIGRFEVSAWESDKASSVITIEGDVESYKLERYSSLEEDWLWDSLDFESGIIREYGEITVEKELKFVIETRRKWVIPIIHVNSKSVKGMTVEFEGMTYTLPNGENRILDIVIKEGSNTLTFYGNGTISIDYKGGSL